MKKSFNPKSLIERAITNFDDFVKVKIVKEDSQVAGNEDDYTEINRKIRKVIIWLSINKGFYAELMSNLDVYGSGEINPKTMCTNGREIIFHPEFVSKQKDEALRLVLAHEILHCIGKHQERRGTRDPQGWNIACDYAINPILDGESGFEWPVDENGRRMGLLEEKYEGMSAEDIYDLLIEEGVLNPNGSPKSPSLIKGSELGTVVDVDSELPGPGQGMDIQVSGDDEGDDEGDQPGGKPGGKPGEDGDEGEDGEGEGDQPGGKPGGQQGGKPSLQLPRVGQKVRLENGQEAVIKKVYPNGDIEV